jgi:hypothetical protein
MNRDLKNAVRARAGYACEYCRISQALTSTKHQVDHIQALQHDGESDLDNLALCCHRCNACKGPNLSGVDPVSKRVTLLDHPRRDKWEEHFRYDDAVLVGLTPTGRATIHVLQINRSDRLEHRQAVLNEGRSFQSGA